MIYIILGVFSTVIIFVITGVLLSRGIQINYHDINKGFDLKIAQITDTHFDDKFKRSDFDTLVDTIQSENPDVLLFTGDLFQVHEISDTLETSVTDFLSELDVKTKIAVLGNHDYYSGSEFTNQVITILENAGFIVLINKIHEVTINDTVYNFVGLDDLSWGNSNYKPILDQIDDNKFTFIVAHEPDTFATLKNYDFITMFSGHSHGGQIRLPLIGDIVNVPGARLYNEHYYNEDDRELYISFGLGESAIRVRFYNKRQFEIYTYS